MKKLFRSDSGMPPYASGKPLIEGKFGKWFLGTAAAVTVAYVGVIGYFVHNMDIPKNIAQVQTTGSYEKYRQMVCPVNCKDLNDAMVLPAAYEVNSSKEGFYKTVFYEDQKKQNILMEGLGDDSQRYFKIEIDGTTMVQRTLYNKAGAWMDGGRFNGKEADEVWKQVKERYAGL